MADDDGGEKSEEPTEKKLGTAREEGNLATSQEVGHWVMLSGALFLVSSLAPGIARDLKILLLPFLSEPHAMPMDFFHLRSTLADLVGRVGMILFLPAAMFVVLALASSIMQHGFSWSTKKITPKMSKFSPIEGAKRIFSVRGVLETVKGIIKLVIVGGVMYALVAPKLGYLALMPAMDLYASLGELQDLTVALLTAVVAALTVLAGADFFFQRYKHMSELRMTKTEVKDEAKSTEGDPQVKARIRQIRAERARVRMMQAVPTASVVVTNPTHYAVALSYDIEAMQAPKLVAKGIDSLALKIREVAEENDVPIVENPPLARTLYAAVDLDQEIPPEHYKPVAEVIGYVMRLKGTLPSRPSS
ncbi:MAG: flagellar biosynthesis protein FlhB [Alphaproteobacteria bacterium]|nr:flagellar biosynthesis protein FlhB [Alphaproteobacteria bacterium]MBF0129540.1 flagellar biosynthesis protein FlhB [Alphaproteobacteria bacterium]